MDDQRPNPDELLKKLQKEAAGPLKRRGKFKLFLGYCAGVGKTYKMLSEARAVKKNGRDIVIGVVETHGRTETQSLLESLELIPRKTYLYKNIPLEEMDIDAVLSRRPHMVIVDELAHTNVKGSRHNKRYQDVEEFLVAGIDVFSTLNIQHVESVIDLVFQITGVKVAETVPNRILELADEIEVVDITTEKLQERLKEGKVYIPQKAQQAMQQFFRKGNLLALRELALRFTAQQVDEDMLSYMEKSGVKGPWEVGSRLLVSITGSPTSEKLIRAAYRMAEDLNAEWYAVYVVSPQQIVADQKAASGLDKNIKLAEALGAKVVALSGNRISEEILKFARERNVTFIIAGFSKRSWFQERFKGSVLNELIKKSGPINVLIVGGDESKQISESSFPLSMRTSGKLRLQSYLASSAVITLTVFSGLLLRSRLDPLNIGMLLLLPVIGSSILWGTRVGIYAALITVGAYDFLFIPPYLTFSVGDVRYIPSFIVFTLVAIVNSFLAKRIRWQGEVSSSREKFLSALYEFNRVMMTANNIDDAINSATTSISEAVSANSLIFLPDSLHHLTLRSMNSADNTLSESELAVASWVYQNGQPAGRNTDTLSASEWYYLPLKSANRVLGVLGVKVNPHQSLLTYEQNRLLESFSNTLALTILRQA